MTDMPDEEETDDFRKMPGDFLDLDSHTARALWRAGLRTREAVAAAGTVGLLRIEGIGRKRLHDIDDWLGPDGHEHQKVVKDAIRLLESEGYAVTGRGYPNHPRPLPGAESFTHPKLLCRVRGFRVLASDVLAIDLAAGERANMDGAVALATAVLQGVRYILTFSGQQLDVLYRTGDTGEWLGDWFGDTHDVVSSWGWTLASCDPRVGGILPLYVDV